jgi:hypothetical protein
LLPGHVPPAQLHLMGLGETVVVWGGGGGGGGRVGTDVWKDSFVPMTPYAHPPCRKVTKTTHEAVWPSSLNVCSRTPTMSGTRLATFGLHNMHAFWLRHMHRRILKVY